MTVYILQCKVIYIIIYIILAVERACMHVLEWCMVVACETTIVTTYNHNSHNIHATNTLKC